MQAIQQLILLICFTSSSSLAAQSPYQLDWKKEPVYLGLGVSTLALGTYLHKQNPRFTAQELAAKDRSEVNSFDRPATFNYSKKADDLSDVLWYSSQAMPVILLASKQVRSDFGKVLLLYGETAFINGGLTALSKSVFKRPRPYVFNEEVDEETKMSSSAQRAFYSGHTSITASNYFFIAKVFSDYYPDSKWKPVIWGLAVSVPAVTGIMRVKAGKHYPTDVIVGYLTGGAIGFLVPHLHKVRASDKGENLSFYPTYKGAAMQWRF